MAVASRHRPVNDRREPVGLMFGSCYGGSQALGFVNPMRLHLIDYVIWWANPVVMMATAGYMLRGKLQRDFPFFFNFVVFQTAAFAVEFSLRNWVNYYYIYWTISGLEVLFSLGVLVELITKVVAGTKTLRNWNAAFLCWCVLVVVMIAAMWPFTNSVDNVTNGIYVVDRTVRVTQFALALFMVLFGAAVGISKRKLTFGIAVGFGFFAAVNLAVMTSLSHHSLLKKMTLSRISAGAYIVSMLIWLAYVATAAKSAAPSRPSGAA